MDHRPSDPRLAELQRLVGERDEATLSGMVTPGIGSGMFLERVDDLTTRIEQLRAEIDAGRTDD